MDKLWDRLTRARLGPAFGKYYRKPPCRDKLTKKECIELKMRIFDRLVKMQKTNGKRLVVRHKLTLKCDHIKVRDHTMPNGYRYYNHYYYQ